MKQEAFDFEAGEVLLLDKPLTWTSFDVVRKVKNTLRIKKIGHAGTLDPLATGLLILCTGKKTKEIDSIQAQEKEYTGTFRLGQTTPSFDLETAVDAELPYAHLTEAEIQAATVPFVGLIEQTPPLFSAVKINGERAYEVARRGDTAEIKSKLVTIREFEITRIALPDVDFRVTCSKGTYVRSLARDFGAALGCGAHLTQLTRTRIGEYSLADALTMEAVQALAPPRSEGSPARPTRTRSDAERRRPVRHGLAFYDASTAAAAQAADENAPQE
jgi:tRNA pseudouridine55 synthase